MNNKNSLTKKAIAGAVITVIGLIVTIAGHSRQQNYDYKFAKAWLGWEQTEVMIIDLIFYGGILIMAIGLIIAIVGIVKMLKPAAAAAPVSETLEPKQKPAEASTTRGYSYTTAEEPKPSVQSKSMESASNISSKV